MSAVKQLNKKCVVKYLLGATGQVNSNRGYFYLCKEGIVEIKDTQALQCMLVLRWSSSDLQTQKLNEITHRQKTDSLKLPPNTKLAEINYKHRQLFTYSMTYREN